MRHYLAALTASLIISTPTYCSDGWNNSGILNGFTPHTHGILSQDALTQNSALLGEVTLGREGLTTPVLSRISTSTIVHPTEFFRPIFRSVYSASSHQVVGISKREWQRIFQTQKSRESKEEKRRLKRQRRVLSQARIHQPSRGMSHKHRLKANGR